MRAQTVSTPSGGPYTSSTYSWVATASAPATHTITGADAAGNTATRAITFTIDSTNPTGSVTTPVAAANVRGGSVVVTVSSADAGSGVRQAQIQTSPAGAATWSNLGAPDTVSPYTTTWDTTTFTDGLYDIRAITTDNVGNTFTSATIANVRVDNIVPTAAVTAPASSAIIKGVYTVTGTATDTGGSGVANALFQRSPAGTNTWTNVAAADTTSPYTASWTTTAVTDGLYDLRVTSTDNAGNTFTSALVTNVRVDNTAPTGAVTAPVASANVRGVVSVTSNSADAGSGVASAQFQSVPHGLTTWANIGAADTTSPYAVSWDTTTFTDGLYDLRVITTDNAGTAFTSATIANVRVDNTAADGRDHRARVVGEHQGHLHGHLELGRRRLGRGERAVPALPRGHEHVDEHRRGRHHDAVHRELGDHGRRRRPLRPPGHHHRQVGEHVHVGAGDERAGRQHRAHRVGGDGEWPERRVPQRGQDLLQGERGWELRFDRHGHRRRLRRRLGHLPPDRHRRMDARGRNRHHARRWPVRVEHHLVDSQSIDAGDVHHHRGRRGGQHRDERVHVHRRQHRTRPAR